MTTAGDGRWQRVESAFHAVVDMAAGAERDAALLASCDGDAGLAAEVAALLAEDERLTGAEVPPDPHLGLRLGNYQIDRVIGRGGMASVYEAHRADDQFQQRVAIKIMDLRLSDPELVARFRAERQILAALEHSALTRLLDGGITALGEPYLVMEYVEGQPIAAFCDERRLDVTARLALFRQVCGGVAFAHRNLVLHRDLKPSNIMVTADGRAKVVDFGTATLLEPERLATVSRAPLTPAYASPEQLTGQPVGTASDQYSLGLVLYELLSGTAPFGDRPSLMAAMERALAGSTTTAPHAVVTAAAAEMRQTSLARLRRVLAGDLGTIVGKALAGEPAARYASVEHLADDLERWADGEPIRAHAPSLTYRTSRFVRRHWIAVSVAAVLLVALVATAAVSIRQAAVARAESAKARQMNRFLTQMLSSANPSWYNASGASAGSITVREALDGASALIAGALGDAPEVEAEMRRTLGRTYIGMSEPDRARPHLERALALHREQGDAFGVAFTEALLGEHWILKGDYPAAEAPLRRSLAYVRSLGDTPVDPELHMMATNDLGLAISGQHPGHPDATVLKQEGIAVADRSPSSAGASIIGRANLSLDFYNSGRLDDAEALLQDALARLDALPTLPERGFVFNNLSQVRRTRGDYAAAERFGARAVEAAAQVWGVGNLRWAAFSTSWGRAQALGDEPARGLATLERVLAAYRTLRPPDHLDTVGVLVGLGTAHRRLERLEESERVLRQAHAIVERHPAQKMRAADVDGELGLTLRARGRTVEAAELLNASHETLLALYGAAHPATRQARARLTPAE